VENYPAPDQDHYKNSPIDPYLPESNRPSESTQSVPVSIPRITPYITYGLIAVTILVYGLQYASESLSGVDYLAFYGAKFNQLILDGQYWRFISPTFLHGSMLHLGFNMYALYVLGIGLERFYGHGRFTGLYFISGFAGNVMSFLFTPAPSLGASTAIFGLIGAQGVFLYQNREIFGRPAQRALMNLVVIALINLIFGLSPGIDNWGHIGGLIAGVLYAWFAGPVIKVGGYYPNFIFVDTRKSSEIIRAAISVVILFGTLAGVTILLRT